MMDTISEQLLFLIYVRDDDFYQLLPPDISDLRFDEGRVQMMAFPPIDTEAPFVCGNVSHH